MEKSKISWIDIFVTERCNLNCKYCFHKKNPIDMSYDTLDKALDFLGNRISENIVFNFFGGEPTLRKDFCIYWIQELKRRFKKCRFHIATNGVLYDQELTDVLRHNKAIVQVSYDGINQNISRGKGDIVLKNLKTYIKQLPISVRLTFTRDTVRDLYKNVEHIYGLGVKRFIHHAELNTNWTDNDIKIYKEQLDKIYEFLDEHDDFDMSFCDCGKIDRQDKQNARCSMGKTLIALSADGSIYPCHRMIKFKQFKIGDIFSRYLDRGKFLNLEILNCSSCKAKNVCHPCMAAFYEFNGSFIEPLKATCEINKYEYDKMKEKHDTWWLDMSPYEDIINKATSVLEDVCDSQKCIIKELKHYEELID